jgi:hypothetical protein
MSDENDPKDKSEEQVLEEILLVFSRKREPGDVPLESLSPSRRLIPGAPLTEEERNVMIWADCRFYGIKAAPPDDPIYRTGYSISFTPRSRQDALNALVKSDIEAMQKSPKRLIDKDSKEPEDRKKWIYWLAAMTSAAYSRAPLPRLREVASSALLDGVNWQELYKAVKSIRPSFLDPMPSLEEVNPKR